MSTGEQEYDYLFKLLLIGNSSVGKSSLLFRFVENVWDDNFVPTIGVDFKLKTLEINGKKVKLQIWDTAGQERFRNITSAYYRGANGVFIVYDITDRDSFDNLNSWLIEIEKNANRDICKMLIGNKCHLEDKRKISYQEGKDFATNNGMLFMEVSSKTKTNVEEAFEKITQGMIKSSIQNDKNFYKKEKTVHLSSQPLTSE